MNLTNDSLIIFATFCGIASFMVIIAFGSLFDYLIRRRKPTYNGSDWIFSNVNPQNYKALFKNKKDVEIAKSLGLNIKEYEEHCKILNIYPNLEKIILFRLYSYTALFSGLIFAVFAQYYLAFFFLAIGMYFLFYPLNQIKSDAIKKKNKIRDEFHRFLDLFLAVSQMEMPINEALTLTADGIKNPSSKVEFADEILRTLTVARVNNQPWTDALVNFAKRYNIDEITDFISTICKSQVKGLPVYGQCLTLSKKVKSDYYINKQIQSKKAENAVLFPILILKFLPLAAFMVYPVLISTSF